MLYNFYTHVWYTSHDAPTVSHTRECPVLQYDLLGQPASNIRMSVCHTLEAKSLHP